MLVMPATLLDHPVRRGLAWIVENRKDKSGRLLSRRQLSILAGLSPAHVGNIMNGHQGADIDHRTAQAIARAANVRTEWPSGALATGHRCLAVPGRPQHLLRHRARRRAVDVPARRLTRQNRPLVTFLHLAS